MSPQSSFCLGQYICQQLLDGSGRWRWVRGGSGVVGVGWELGEGWGPLQGRQVPSVLLLVQAVITDPRSLVTHHGCEPQHKPTELSQLDRCTAQNGAAAASDGSDLGPALLLACTAPAGGTEDFVLTSVV